MSVFPSSLAGMAKTEEAEIVETEADRVFMWRYECLLRVGIPDDHAGIIAGSSFDLRRAVELAEQGCPADLLARIVV